MKNKVTVVCIREVGNPEQVVRVEQWELPPLQPHQVLVEMKAAPINPADLNVLEGKYPFAPPPPCVVGNEGVGVVAECGAAVEDLQVGQPVIAPARVGSWCEAYVAAGSELVALPTGVPLEQAAMLAVNPPTAWRMLHDFVPLNPGDWVIQNAANSGVGRSVIQIARHLGWRTVNVVRRKELIPELQGLGADVVVTDEEQLSNQIRDLTGGAQALLGLNAVGGDSARRMARSLAPHGTLVTYGAMSRQPLQIENGLLIFKDIRFRGFVITQWMRSAGTEQRRELFAELVPLVQKGELHVPAEKKYRLQDARAAVRHASQSGRSGKILFVMS